MWVNSAIAGLAQTAVANGAKEWKLSDIPDSAKLAKYSSYDGASIYSSVTDGRAVVDVPNILRAYTLGLVNGADSKGTLNPDGNLTRAGFCQLLYNAGIFGFIKPSAWSYSFNFASNLHVNGIVYYIKNYTPDGTYVGD